LKFPISGVKERLRPKAFVQYLHRYRVCRALIYTLATTPVLYLFKELIEVPGFIPFEYEGVLFKFGRYLHIIPGTEHLYSAVGSTHIERYTEISFDLFIYTVLGKPSVYRSVSPRVRYHQVYILVYYVHNDFPFLKLDAL